MQFIENTRSKSFVIEYFRHFFYRYVHFRTPGRSAFRRGRQSGVEPACPPRRASARQATARQKKSPTLTNRAWGTRQRTPGCAKARAQQAAPLRRQTPRSEKRAWGTQKGKRPIPPARGNGTAETQRACAGNPRVRE